MKREIKQNLERLFFQNYQLIKNSSFLDLVDKLIKNNPDTFNLDIGATTKLYNDKDISNLNDSKKNKVLLESFDLAKDGLKENKKLKEDLRTDILSAIDLIKKKVSDENNGFKTQIIFLEHNFEPYSYFCGFGEGEYPILDSPKYIEFNSREEIFNGVGCVNYEQFWNKKNEFDKLIREDDLTDMIWDSEIYQGLRQAYNFKTNLILFEAFDQIPIETFEGIPIKLPLFIFGNEHDCEAMNVYLYE